LTRFSTCWSTGDRQHRERNDEGRLHLSMRAAFVG
jgi:hypothetical protein